jgi:hypothetical protein
MHVLGNAQPTENVAVRYQFTCGGDDIEIHRARQVIHLPKTYHPVSKTTYLGVVNHMSFS